MLSAIRKWLQLDPEPAGVPFQAPVFIVGCMRSGTTFLVDKLTQHPQLLKVGSELREVWTDIGGAPCGGEAGLYRGVNDARPEYAANMAAYFEQFVQESRSMRRHLMRAKQKWKQDSSAIFYDWDHVIPVNKSTHLVNKIAYVHTLFPTARFIFIMRDMPGQVASLKVHSLRHYDTREFLLYAPAGERDSWGQGKRALFPESARPEQFFPDKFSLLPELWMRLNGIALAELSQLPPDLYRVIDYRDVVEHQASMLGQLFDFLPLRKQHHQKAATIAGKAMKIINTTSSGNPLNKWEQTLSAEEKDILASYQAQPAYQELVDRLEAMKLKPVS